MSAPSPRRSTRFPTIPNGEAVGSYETYEAAQSAVDQLVRADFPLRDVSIIGSNLKSVERVTGKMNAGRAALSGLLSGVMLGVFVGLLLLIIMPQQMQMLIPIMLVAVGFSVLWSLIGFMLNPGKKEFTSVMQIVAAHFDVVVTPALAGRARQTLGTTHATTPVAHATPPRASDAWPNAQPAAPSHDPQAGAAQPGVAPWPGDVAQPGDAAQQPAPQEPAQPPRTYGEAQDALRRERESRAGGGDGNVERA